MDGFLPLIEAFLAFALTMLALTTAVSAIVGACQRALRWRARVLREMVEFFYRNEVEDRIATLQQAPGSAQTATNGEPQPGPDGEPPTRAAAAGSGVVAAHAPNGAGNETSEVESYLAAPGKVGYRRLFVAQMTLLPTVLLKGGKPDRKARESEIKKTEGPLTYKSWFMSWRSLRYGLDRLSDQDFLVRLRASLPGRAIDAIAGTTADDVFKDLQARFDAHGVAAVNQFEKRSRKWSVAVAFVVAFAVNVDALFLLNSYLTNEDLRLRVIADSDRIVEEADSDLEKLTQARASVSPEVQALSDRFTEAVQFFEGLSEDSAAALDDAELVALRGTVDRLKSGISASLDTAADSAAITKQASAEIRGVVLSLTQSFPVGWTLYPNCPGIDPRCAAADGKTALFVKWLAGVLITGFMVGLGTPFWIQIVNGALRSRNWLRDYRPAETAQSAVGGQT